MNTPSDDLIAQMKKRNDEIRKTIEVTERFSITDSDGVIFGGQKMTLTTETGIKTIVVTCTSHPISEKRKEKRKKFLREKGFEFNE